MPKVKFVLPNGTKVSIEGEPEDLQSLAGAIAAADRSHSVPATSREKPAVRRHKAPAPPTKSSGPTGYILELKEEGFFIKKRTIGEVQQKLEENGRIYALTSLSPALLRLARSRKLGRLREGGAWKYVQR